MSTDFYSGLPQKRMGAGCLLFNAEGEILLLQPTYKPTWEIPGGVVELDESPLAACIREVREEIGLDVPVQRLLVVDYNTYPDDALKTESLMFIFDGGVLSTEMIKRITLPGDEIASFCFFAPDALPENLNPALRGRVLAAIGQKRQPENSYFENQQSPAGT